MVLQRFFILDNGNIPSVINNVLENCPNWETFTTHNNFKVLKQRNSQKAIFVGRFSSIYIGKWPAILCEFGYFSHRRCEKRFVKQPDGQSFISFSYLAEKTDIDGTYKYLLEPVPEDIPNILSMGTEEISKLLIPKISTVISRVAKEISKLPEPMICGKCFAPCCIRISDYGKKFFGCSRYMECKFTMSFGEGAKTLYADYLLPKKNNQK